MLELKGKYASAKVFTDNIEEEAMTQIIQLCNQEFVEGCTIRIMPDCHAGVGCVIGFTADLGDKVIPNIVGVDLGCGMLTIKLGNIAIDLEKLDNVIKQNVPSGFDVRKEKIVNFDKLRSLHCYNELNDIRRIERSIGTLGGGNHFIEVNVDGNDNKYLVIHTGSRNLGKQVAEIYQNLAVEMCSGKEDYYLEKERITQEYKQQGKEKQLKKALKKLKKRYKNLKPKYPKDLCFLTGKYRELYLHDMKICQEYASVNRETIANIILKYMFNTSLDAYVSFHTIHNYIDFKDNIIRKGSISAYKGEKILIPINMRDGSLLCVGKGNPDWNYSAPHGAGRLLSRRQAKRTFDLEEFKRSMEGIYTTSVNARTIDECPMAYKPMDEIIDNIQDIVEIIDVIKPIYNFKASS